jgi:hypothetical protein
LTHILSKKGEFYNVLEKTGEKKMLSLHQASHIYGGRCRRDSSSQKGKKYGNLQNEANDERDKMHLPQKG